MRRTATEFVELEGDWADMNETIESSRAAGKR
jgi:hypothetical protein